MSEHISARRAWHDTYFIKTPNKIEMLAQNTTLGTMISQMVWERARDAENPDYRKRLIVGSHMTLTGTTSRSAKLGYVQPDVDLLAKVKRCIQNMPTEHQLFGHYFYGPFADDIREQLAEFVTGFIFSELEEIIPDALKTIRQRYRALCLIRAISDSHYRTIFGGEPLFSVINNPSRFDSGRAYSSFKICDYVKQKYNVSINAKNWQRDAEPMHDAICKVIGDVERKCLGQVAGMIKEFSDQKEAC